MDTVQQPTTAAENVVDEETSRRPLQKQASVQFIARATGMIPCFVLVGSAYWDRSVSWQWWGPLVFHTAVWPYLANVLAKRQKNPRSMLDLAMYVDAWLVGNYAATLELSLWPTVAVLGANAVSNVNTGGLKLEAKAFGLTVVGYVMTGAVFGFRYHPESSQLTSFLGIAFVLSYIAIVSNAANKVVTELRKTKLLVEKKNLEISEFAASLERRVDEKTHELRDANEKLSQADRLKDEFLANTSHELRTPLNGIIGLAEAMLEGSDGNLPATTNAKAQMIVASGRRLGALVNDILDFSKLRHRQLALQERSVDLASVVGLVLTLSKHLVLAKGLVLENKVPNGVWVLADENRLQQILYNLVGNAIKFTESGTITVSAETKENMVEISIVDTGIGIDADKFQKIFESFEQADGSTARRYGGTGLGLAITRQLVELHGGKISVESTVGQGSCFRFSLRAGVESTDAKSEFVTIRDDVRDSAMLALLQSHEVASLAAGVTTPPAPNAESLSNGPRSRPPIRPASVPPPLAISERRIRMLAADDDPVNLAVLMSQLQKEGFEIVQARDGAEALEKFEKEGPFDAILLDVMMPKKTGYEVCQDIRRKFGPADLPIVLLTAKNQVQDLVYAFDAGANDYLNKPFSKRELLARIQSHLEVSRTHAAFGRFVPHEFLKLLGRRNAVEVALGDNVEKQMTVLFSDIRNFTSMAEKMSPPETFRFVNGCLSRIGPEIRKNAGFIDKYIGDAVMALFPKDPSDAVRAAVGIQEQVTRYNDRMKSIGGAKLSVGVGVHVGPTMLGTIGENERFEATVISDTVNLASRVEGLTKYLRTNVLLTETVVKQSGITTLSTRFVGAVKVKGKQSGVGLFELLDADDPHVRQEKESSREEFSKALSHFNKGDFALACAGFDSLGASFPSDGPVEFYSSLCRKYLSEGPPADFDGSVAFDTK